MSVTDIFPKEKEEKVGTLFYRMAIRRLLRKWLRNSVRNVIVADDFRKLWKEKAITLFYRIIYKIVISKLVRKWPGRIRSWELRTPRINRTGSRSKGSESPSELIG